MVKDMPLVPFERILKKAGAKRVSKSALIEFSEIIIDYAHDLSAKAAELAEHAGRKTIIGADIKLAKKKS